MSGLAAALLSELRDANDFATQLRRRARARPGRVALPGAEDPRIAAAAIALVQLGLGEPLLIGDVATVQERLRAEGAEIARFEISDAAQDPRRRQIAERLLLRRGEKGMQAAEAERLAGQPLHFAAGLLGSGQVDAVVAGATHATAEVIRAGLCGVGTGTGITSVSGAFLLLPGPSAPLSRPLLFADAAVIPMPSDEQLVAIAQASARSFRLLCQREPRIACLSFSTYGSAEHPSAERMRRLAQRLVGLGLCADGELQLDAALLPEVAATKAPGSRVEGMADILIFPDLNAANIGYKIAQRLGGYSAIGPLLQGFAHPMHDLSRACSARDVVDVCAIALLEAMS